MESGMLTIRSNQVDTNIPSVILDKDIHRQITNELRERMPYGKYDKLYKDRMFQLYREVLKIAVPG